MAKSSFYFDHDYNARNDQKILELRAEYGWNGYGIYFGLIEVLCESSGEIKRGALGGLSLGLGIDKKTLQELLDFMVSIDLLHEENGVIYSDRVNEHLAYRTMLSEAGKRGGRPPKKAPLNPPLSPRESRKGEERIEKDSKVIKKDLIYIFETDAFKHAWEQWKSYKKAEYKFTYKSTDTEQVTMNSLQALSGNNEQTAIKIINQSIANNWKGFFALKVNDNAATSEYKPYVIHR